MDELGLETVAHKVRPTRESLEHMKYFRDVLEVIRNEIPQVRGLVFFGSRSRGQERRDTKSPSDLDVVVFYDGSEYTSSGRFRLFDTEGNLIPDFIQKNEKYQTDKRMLSELQRKIKLKFEKLMNERGLPVEIIGSINGTILVEDLSLSATDEALEQLKMNIDAAGADEEIPVGIINYPAFRIASRFLLGVGDEVYQNREYILNRLEEMEQKGEQGERYFRGLMNCLLELQSGEHGLQPKLPATIKEAREYFRVK